MMNSDIDIFIYIAYGVAAIILTGLVVITIIQLRNSKKRLNDIEKKQHHDS